MCIKIKVRLKLLYRATLKNHLSMLKSNLIPPQKRYNTTKILSKFEVQENLNVFIFSDIVNLTHGNGEHYNGNLTISTPIIWHGDSLVTIHTAAV